MNKKFSTFLVGALLASSMSVVAQTDTDVYAKRLPLEESGKYLYELHVLAADKADAATAFATAVAGGAGTKVVGATKLVSYDKGGVGMYAMNATVSDFLSSLWCIDMKTEEQGRNPIYDFTNKKYGYRISANEENAPLYDVGATQPTDTINIAQSNLSGWKFSDAYKDDLAQGAYLATYFSADSVLVLAQSTQTGKIGVKKYHALEVDEINDDAQVLRFFVYIPGGRYLTAAEYNTVLGTQPTGPKSLTFTRDRNNTSLKNPFSDYTLTAEDAITIPAAANAANWLRFTNSDSKYLRVDTSYANSVGVKFLNFAFGDKADADAATGDAAHWNATGHYPIPDQHKFALEYFVYNDSVAIDVLEARYNLEDNKNWNAATVTKWGVTFTPSIGNISGTDSLHFKVQDLVTADQIRIVTIGTKPVNTKAILGVGACFNDGPTLTSVADNLYTIRNTSGQYLIVPIYTDSIRVKADYRDQIFPQWKTLDALTDPNQIPAFQWIVEKTRKNDPGNTSPIRITNREFGFTLDIVQLSTTGDGAPVGFGYLKASGFTAVPDAQKADPHLGYKFVDEEMSSVYTYVFNYLNIFAPEDESLFLGVNNTVSDSLMHVGGKTEFQIIPMAKKATNYGAMPSYKTGAFANIAQLERYSYMLKIKDANKLSKSNKVLVVDQEKRYAITDTSYLKVNSTVNGNQRTWGVDTAIFYLKTNNTKDGKDFYAMLDTNSFTPNWTTGGIPTGNGKTWMVKAGVSEIDKFVRVQNQKEERTSTFSIDLNDDPLYRRFNTEKEGQKNDNPDTVKFFRMNNPVDMLYEDAHSVYSNDVNTKPINPNDPKGKINFLGLQNSGQFPNANYAIYVDTAFVARPATKDSKIDTPKPQYMLVVEPEIVPPGTYCPVHGIGATCGHQVNTEGFVYGRYLINATDSAKNFNYTNPNASTIRDSRYIWDTKWERLVFVNAIHKGDTLYLLKEGFNLKEGQLITNEALRNISYKWFDLGNNLHKDVVFSFRLIGKEDNFLIESETTKRITTGANAGLMIAPFEGGWVKWQNGVPVISRDAYKAEITEAEKFNVVKTDEAPLANDEINVGDDVFNVTAGIGNVTIKNAAGSKVTISNILGQTVASATLTNDNQTISVPAGIIVVAVEGEAAVKAIVK